MTIFSFKFFLFFPFILKMTTLWNLKLIALDISELHNHKKEIEVFYLRGGLGRGEGCVVLEAEKLVKLYQTFEKEKKGNSLQDEPQSMAISRLNVFGWKKMNILKCKRRNGTWFIITWSFCIIQDPHIQLAPADSTNNQSHKNTEF